MLFLMEQADHLIRGLAEVIRAAIDERGLTLREVSDATGIPTTTLHRRITQPSPFNITELASLATLMGTTAVDLMVAARNHSPASDGTSDRSRADRQSQVNAGAVSSERAAS